MAPIFGIPPWWEPRFPTTFSRASDSLKGGWCVLASPELQLPAVSIDIRQHVGCKQGEFRAIIRVTQMSNLAFQTTALLSMRDFHAESVLVLLRLRPV